MEKENWEDIGARVIDIEMCLIQKKDRLNTIPEGECKEKMKQVIKELEANSESLQEMVRINRNDIQQKKLLNCVEIVGLPADIYRNIESVADVLSQVIDTQIDERAIEDFEVIEDSFTPDPGKEEPKRCRILVVRFSDLDVRHLILSNAMTSSLIYQGVIPIYINEHLTHMNRLIFQKASQEAERLQIEHVWVEGGKIFMLKDANSAIHQIRSDADIQNMSQF